MKKNNQIKKIIISLLSVVLLTILLPDFNLNVSAFDDVLWDDYSIPSTRQKPRLLDNANLLDSSEEAEILEKLDKLSEKHSSNICILTVNDHTGNIQDFVDDYFDYNGFGADYNGSGIIFMLSMADREWAISTSGSAIYAFTDYGQSKMVDEMAYYLSDDDYYNAFNEYCKIADKYFDMYESGNAYDINNTHSSGENVRALIICIIAGFLLALIPIFVMKADLAPVHMNANASGYATASGIHMDVHRDTYLRSTTSRTKKPENDSSRSGGGGSSIHTSSSGSSHGGSHGHF